MSVMVRVRFGIVSKYGIVRVARSGVGGGSFGLGIMVLSIVWEWKERRKRERKRKRRMESTYLVILQNAPFLGQTPPVV